MARIKAHFGVCSELSARFSLFLIYCKLLAAVNKFCKCQHAIKLAGYSWKSITENLAGLCNFLSACPQSCV